MSSTDEDADCGQSRMHCDQLMLDVLSTDERFKEYFRAMESLSEIGPAFFRKFIKSFNNTGNVDPTVVKFSQIY
ncbi:hypothetical protein CDAR_22521 [Caerostris darwini]|uniref:Uncharacterized protein n=1 Tax=Caerostris darwini TaxID=1538125 RepID=A0AAV4V7Y1_9ARAC|nr:hypothetical protein CDAR_22521 [Caerostris darwini]